MADAADKSNVAVKARGACVRKLLGLFILFTLGWGGIFMVDLWELWG
jgi:hypothetical protein